ncbi:hypothetical protein [Halogeometricum limi]|uniref:Uncharacterized protein n=1 Tax=Halogeometricum limi TaxID=555875 RepID=A0A1I6HX26_9EURY|nr:hypothetical protein [Halogeometricum limi]SFR59003.1 hypothetical protein SAMN04488124_2559 [Halogeometricum limi]
MEPGLSDVPDALAAYAVGVGRALGRGAFYTAVFLVVFFGIGFAPVGMGVVLVLLAVVLPAVGAAVALELPRVLRERFGGT